MGVPWGFRGYSRDVQNGFRIFGSVQEIQGVFKGFQGQSRAVIGCLRGFQECYSEFEGVSEASNHDSEVFQGCSRGFQAVSGEFQGMYP